MNEHYEMTTDATGFDGFDHTMTDSWTAEDWAAYDAEVAREMAEYDAMADLEEYYY